LDAACKSWSRSRQSSSWIRKGLSSFPLPSSLFLIRILSSHSGPSSSSSSSSPWLQTYEDDDDDDEFDSIWKLRLRKVKRRTLAWLRVPREFWVMFIFSVVLYSLITFIVLHTVWKLPSGDQLKPATVGPDEFSYERALNILYSLSVTIGSRPVGSYACQNQSVELLLGLLNQIRDDYTGYSSSSSSSSPSGDDSSSDSYDYTDSDSGSCSTDEKNPASGSGSSSSGSGSIHVSFKDLGKPELEIETQIATGAYRMGEKDGTELNLLEQSEDDDEPAANTDQGWGGEETTWQYTRITNVLARISSVAPELRFENCPLPSFLLSPFSFLLSHSRPTFF
jgi:hypothetical protein